MRVSRFIAARLAGSRQKTFTRTIIRLATAAVAISLAVMIVTVALVRGFKKEISEKVFGFWGHINITDIRADASYEALPIYRDTALLASILDVAQVEMTTGLRHQIRLSSRGGVSHVQAVAQIPAIIKTGEQMEGIVLKGVGSDYAWETMQRFLVAGTVFDPAVPADQSGILISQYTADRLEVAPGDRFILHFLREDRQVQRRFEVRGIYRTGLEEYDQKFAFTPLPQVQALLGWEEDQIAAYEVFVEHVDDAGIINEYIYVEELPSELYSETIRQKFPNIFEWLDLQDVNQMVIVGLTLIVAVINMISVLLILILERTRMIGVLKALGGTSWMIQKIFLAHAGRIILIGLLIGNLIGLGLCAIQDSFRVITLNEADYYLSYAPVDIGVWHILALNSGTIIITLLFLLVPSLLITRITPVRTLRFA